MSTSPAHRNSPTADGRANDLIRVCRSATLRTAEYQFYRALLLTFPATGGPPDQATLRALARRFGVPLHATLTHMTRQDLAQRDHGSGAVRAAYPFSGIPTVHRVTLLTPPAQISIPAEPASYFPIQVYAMCALDALGIPLMLHCDALVTSADAQSGDEIRVRVMRPQSAAEIVVVDRGGERPSATDGWVAVWEPSTAVVFARPEDHECEDGVAAGSCCPLTNFFATHEQAQRWAAAHGSSEDVVLAQDEALRRAALLFVGVLDRLDG
jgi:Alkylmercury lyase